MLFAYKLGIGFHVGRSELVFNFALIVDEGMQATNVNFLSALVRGCGHVTTIIYGTDPIWQKYVYVKRRTHLVLEPDTILLI